METSKMIRDYIKLAYNSVKHRRLRAWLTIIGIIVGIAAIISLISLTQGMQYAIEKQFESFGATTIRITPKGLRGPPTGSDYFTDKDINVIEKIPGVEYVNPFYMESAIVKYKNQEIYTQVIGYPLDTIDDMFRDLDIKVEQGREFTSSEKYSIIIGPSIADNFDEEPALRSTIEIKNKKFKIIGILEQGNQATDNSIIIPIKTAREIFDAPGGISAITAKVLDGIDIEEIGEKIQRRLEHSRDNENFEVFTPKQLLSQINQILGIVQFVLVGISAISLLVGGIGIMNSMYTSVLERTRQIGIMKAVGARNSHILMIFLIEAGFIGLIGGLAGTIIGYAISFAVQLIAAQLGFALIKITLSYKLILFGLLFAFIIGSLSGLHPAYRASKLKPVDALRYE